MQLVQGASQESEEPTESEKKIWAHMKGKVEEIRNSATRIAHECVWMTNIASILGYDGVTFDHRTRTYVPVDSSAGYIKRNRIHVNSILPKAQNLLARLCKNPPKFNIPPESNDSEDKDAARFNLDVLGAMWNRLSIDQKRIFLYMWVLQCGHAWLKIVWDTTLGKVMKDPVTGALSFEGDVRADIVSPFEVFPNPLAKTAEEVRQTWMIQCKVRTLDYFRDHYEKGYLVKEEDVWLLSTQHEAGINSITSDGSGEKPAEGQKNCAIEIIKYEARSKKHPNGRMIVGANGVILEDKELPVGIVPFAQFCGIIVGGKLYPETPVTHARPIQDQKNLGLRRRAEWMKNLLAGKYGAARGTELKKEQLTNGTEVVWFTPVPNAPEGGKPSPIQVPTLPQWAYQEDDRYDAELNDIFGLSEVSQGTLPSASIPAIGMQLLTEQDDTRIGVMTTQHEGEWAFAGSLILKYVEKFYVMARKFKFSGQNMGYVVKEVSGEMIRGNTDVQVVPGSTRPGSKTLANQEILNRFDRGLLGPQTDPRVIAKVNEMTEFGSLSEIWQDFSLDMHQIKKGTDLIEKGELPEVSDFDNHELWIQELNRYRKSDKFEQLDPDMQAGVIALMETHTDSLMTMTGTMPPEPNIDDLPPPIDEASEPLQPESEIPMAGGF